MNLVLKGLAIASFVLASSCGGSDTQNTTSASGAGGSTVASTTAVSGSSSTTSGAGGAGGGSTTSGQGGAGGSTSTAGGSSAGCPMTQPANGTPCPSPGENCVYGAISCNCQEYTWFCAG